VRTGKPPAAKLAVEEMDLIVFDERDCGSFAPLCGNRYEFDYQQFSINSLQRGIPQRLVQFAPTITKWEMKERSSLAGTCSTPTALSSGWKRYNKAIHGNHRDSLTTTRELTGFVPRRTTAVPCADMSFQR
jgi:hypothetical protein